MSGLGATRPPRRRPIAVAAAILGIWWLVAHNGGSGWVQALGDIVFGTLVIGILGPGVVLTRARVRWSTPPSRARRVCRRTLRIAASTRLRVRPVSPPGDEVFVGPVGGHRAPEEEISLLPTCRGIHETVTLDIATAAPFALQWWTRRVVLPLPAVLHVAPRRGRPWSLPLRDHEEEAGAVLDWLQADVGEPRGSRPYRPGDTRRRVHWRATAHAGELMVSEVEGPSSEPVTLTVTLPPDPEEAERVAERALGTVVQFLERGAPVHLATLEAAGPVVALVADRRIAGRRLARAVPRAQIPPARSK